MTIVEQQEHRKRKDKVRQTKEKLKALDKRLALLRGDK